MSDKDQDKGKDTDTDKDKLLEERALQATGQSGLQAALDWLAEHQDDGDAEAPKDAQDDKEPEAQSLKCNECGKLFTTVEMAQLHATKTGHQDFAESTEANPVLTPEQKTQRLAELREKLAEKRRLEAVKAEEEARENEKIRRKAGMMTADAKREMKEREMIKAAEQARKDKAEEKALLAKIRAEMEEEKRLRREKSGGEGGQDGADVGGVGSVGRSLPPQEPIKLVSQDSDSVRIQVKLPWGDNLRAVFKSTETIADLADKIKEKGPITKDNRLMIPFPHKVISVGADWDKTFMELGLCPSATLILE